jgi:signal transduction histidine kinase
VPYSPGEKHAMTDAPDQPGMLRPSLAIQFLFGSLAVLLLGMAAVGAWVARQIEDGVVHRTGAATALYVDSLIASSLQDLAKGPLSAASADHLDWLLHDTPLGQQVAVFQVWDRSGTIVYSTAPEKVGQRFPIDAELRDALAGQVGSDIGEIEGGAPPGTPDDHMIEIYSPVRDASSGAVIGAAEFYFDSAGLQADIAAAQRRSWLVVGVATALIYLLLSIFVRRASDTIVRQQRALANQVVRLTDLLRQNDELHERVRGAAARTTALNERFLRRFSAELHDGPAQEIGLALLRLDHVAERSAAADLGPADRDAMRDDLDRVQASLQRALQEIRSLSGGLSLPHLATLSVAETVDHVVRGHRRRAGAAPEVDVRDLPAEAPLATKIALYRIVQEALANAWRHAGGAGLRLHVTGECGRLRVEVADAGPGFDLTAASDGGERLGLLGMRERVESLGGEFRVESAPGAGARIVATLPMTEERHG